MDVDATNFDDALFKTVKAALNEADYIALDLEMTGIHDSAHQPSGSDSTAVRYRKNRVAAKKYGVMQVGIAAFKGEEYRAWNFYVFPRPVNDLGVAWVPSVGLCSAAIAFLREQGMDFQRWIDKGLTYVNAVVESRLAEALEKESREDSSGEGLPEIHNPQAKQNVENTVQAVAEFAKDPDRDSYKMPNLRGVALKVATARIKANHPDLLVESVRVGAYTERFVTRRSMRDLVREKLGFRRVWKALLQAKKPIILHNGMLDLMWMLQQFDQDLPSELANFKARVRQLFPSGIYDTRQIAIESGYHGVGLSQLAERFAHDPVVEKIHGADEFSRKFDGEDGEEKFHEAGFDAVATGKVFAALTAKMTDEEKKQFINFVALAQSYYCVNLSEAAGDRAVNDRPRQYRVLEGIPIGTKNTDVLGLVEEVRSHFQEKEAGMKVYTYIDWIDDTRGVLHLTPIVHREDDMRDDEQKVAREKEAEINTQLGVMLDEALSRKVGTSAEWSMLKIRSLDDYLKSEFCFTLMDYDCSNGAFSAAWRAVGALEGELEKLMGPGEAGEALEARSSRQWIDFRVVPKGEKHHTFDMVHIDRKPLRPFQPCPRGRGQLDGTKAPAKKPTALIHPRPWGASDRQCAAQKGRVKPVNVENPPAAKPDCLARGIAVAEVSSDFLDLCVEAMSRWVVLDALETLPLKVDASFLGDKDAKAIEEGKEGAEEHTVAESIPSAEASLQAIIQQLDETCLSLSHSFDLDDASHCQSDTKEEGLKLESEEAFPVRDYLETLVKAETECSMKVDFSSGKMMSSPRRQSRKSKTSAAPPPMAPIQAPLSPSRSAVDRLYRGESSLSSSRSLKGSRKSPTSSRPLRSISSPTDQSLLAESSVDSSASVRSPTGARPRGKGSRLRLKSPSSTSGKRQDEQRDSFTTVISYNSADFVSLSSGPHEETLPLQEASNHQILNTSACSQAGEGCDGSRERRSTASPEGEAGRGKVREFGTGGNGRKYGSSGRFSIRSERQKSKHRISRPAVKAVRGWSLELARSASDLMHSAHEGPIVRGVVDSEGPKDGLVQRSRPSDADGVSQLDLELVVEGEPEAGISPVTAGDMKSPRDNGVVVEVAGGSDVELSLSPSPRVRCSSPVPAVTNPALALLESSSISEPGEPLTAPNSVEPRRAPRAGMESDSVSIMSSCSSSFLPKDRRPPLPSSGSIAIEQPAVSVAAASPRVDSSVPSVVRNGGDTQESSFMTEEATFRLPTRTARSMRTRSSGLTLDPSSPPPPPARRRSPFGRSSMARSSSDSTFEQFKVTDDTAEVCPPQEPPSTPTRSGRRWLDKPSVSDAALQSLSGMSPEEPSRDNECRVNQEHSYWSARPRQVSRPIGSPASAPAEILLPLHRECERITTGRVCRNRKCDACAVYEDLMRSSLAAAAAARARMSRSSLRGKFSVMSVEEDEGDEDLIAFTPRRPPAVVGKRSLPSEGPALVDSVVSDAADQVIVRAPVCEADDASKSPDDKTSEETPLTPNSVWNIGSSPRAAHSSQDEEQAAVEEDITGEASASLGEASHSPISASATPTGQAAIVTRTAAPHTSQEEGLQDGNSVPDHVEVLNGLPGHGPNPSAICDSRRCVVENSSFARRLKMSSHRFRKKKSRVFSDDPEEEPLAPEQTTQGSPRSEEGSEDTAEPVLVPLENSFVDSSGEEGPGDPERTDASHGLFESAEMLPPLGGPIASPEHPVVERRVVVGQHLAPMPQRVSLQRRGFIRQAPNLPAVVLRERPQLIRFTFRGHSFHVVNFDVADDSAFEGATYTEGICSHSRCPRKSHPPSELVDKLPESVSESLGSVLWFDAAIRFLNWAGKHRRSYKGLRILGLGEGTGVTSLALAADGAADVYISDLPELFPLLEVNCSSKLNPRLKGRAKALALDWVDEDSFPVEIEGCVDVVVCCEILYGNRFVWPGLVRVLERSLAPEGVAMFAITLRNARHDVDDFCALAKSGGKLRVAKEEYLSPEVVVVQIKLAKKAQKTPPVRGCTSTAFGSVGRLCLWHFPSKQQLVYAREVEQCDVIVTLQGKLEQRQIEMIPTTCSALGMQWIQCNFWSCYYQHRGYEDGHDRLMALFDALIELLKEGKNILIHCAAGVHRTGMCTYGLLRRLGLTSDEALEYIKSLRPITYVHCGMQRFKDMEARCLAWGFDDNYSCFKMAVPFSLASAPPSLHVGEISEAIGFTQMWGNSFASDLINEPLAQSKGQLPPRSSLNILTSGAGDIRHILKTLARRHSDDPPLHFYVHESSPETLARHIFFLDLVANPQLTIRERCELFLSLYGNALVRALMVEPGYWWVDKIRKKDARYLSEQVRRLQALVSGDADEDPSLAGLSKLLDFSTLKFKDRDAVHESIGKKVAPDLTIDPRSVQPSFARHSTFIAALIPSTAVCHSGFWYESVEFDAKSLRDQRLRGYYKTRYEHRKNLLDWDYHNGIRTVAPAVHWQEYKSFGLTGICYETRLGTYDEPNRTMASYVDGRCRSKGTSVQVRGFWADIINSPLACFGAEAYNKCDQERLFKTSNEQHVHSSHEIADFNLACILSEIVTRQVKALPPKTKGEESYPYKSPLEQVRCTIEEVEEEDSDTEGSGDKGRILPAGFNNVRIHFMLGDIRKDILQKQKFKGKFDRLYIGSSLASSLLVDEKVEDGGLFREALVDSAQRPASTANAVDSRIQVHFSGKQKLAYRKRIEEACKSIGLEPDGPSMTAPNVTQEMKPGEARELEESLPSTVHYRLVEGESLGA
ncbi:hypothetical protein FOL47_008019 [Perkinsus chesapeaki]|uniref:Tyrosine specific protein phosphatases domain-containing protein n=1 Tax=Perkinsus chesapeaki TaxID=330153 RepID=A0A7J6LGP3_PERCH|nr:hypothetical protein FOL47_008019 [Perkinsus chesapeaki]